MVPDTLYNTYMVQLCKRSSFAERVPSALFTVTGRKILIKPSLTYGTVRGRWLESSTYKEAENLDHIKVFGFFIYFPSCHRHLYFDGTDPE